MMNKNNDEPNKETTTKKKKVAIIGAGISGIGTAMTLQDDGCDCVIYEAANAVGGVWKHDSYPGVRLQNLCWQYHHPDLEYDESDAVDANPTREQILGYLEYCVSSYKLKVELNTKIIKIEELTTTAGDENGWMVTSEKMSNNNNNNVIRGKEKFDFVIIASGQYSKDNDAARQMLQKWKGLNDFTSNGGKVLTRHDLTDFTVVEKKRVAIIGFGKTAVDLCQMCCENGAQSAHHIFRTARWLVPRHVFGVHYTFLLFNRMHGETLTAWDYPSAQLHANRAPAEKIFTIIWGVIQRVAWLIYSSKAWFKGKAIRERFALLKPQHHILRDHRSAAALCPPRFYDKVASGELIPIQGSIKELTKSGITMEDGTKVEVDVIMDCTGNGSIPPTFPYLPSKYRAMLEGAHGAAVSTQLYRHLIHPDIRNLAFAGFNHGFLHWVHVYLGTIWLGCLMRGEMKLPSSDEQHERMRRMAAWKKEHVSYEPAVNFSVGTRLFQYNDVIMMDLGLKPQRKTNPISEFFARYGAADYKGVLAEVQHAREVAKDAGRPFMLHPVDRDM